MSRESSAAVALFGLSVQEDANLAVCLGGDAEAWSTAQIINDRAIRVCPICESYYRRTDEHQCQQVTTEEPNAAPQTRET